MRIHFHNDSCRTRSAIEQRHGARAFTLVELLVTLVIVSILASLTLAGLAGARNRSKIGKTASTIRKINDLIQPLYDAYTDRRVDVSDLVSDRPTNTDCPGCYAGSNPIAVKAAAWRNLYAKRQLMAYELPDSLLEMRTERELDLSVPPDLPIRVRNSASVRRMARTFTVGTGTSQAAQDSRRQALANTMGSAESLLLTILANAHQGDEMELFRENELGDTDGDGLREFLDGWQRPIFFIRWPSGFASYSAAMNPESQPLASLMTARPDPLDPYRVDANGGFGLVPLIYSAGPDGSTDTGTQANGYGLFRVAGVRLDPYSPFNPNGGILPPTAGPVGNNSDNETTSFALNVGAPVTGASENVYRDNITNHDMRR